MAVTDKSHAAKPRAGSSDTRDFWVTRLRAFCQSVAFTGLRYVSSPSEHVARRVLWALLGVVGIVLVALQMKIQAVKYISRPTAVDIRERFVRKMPFPTVTICPESKYHLTKANTAHPDMGSAMHSLYEPLINYNETWRLDHINVTGYSTNWTATNIDMSVTAEETIFHCLFQGNKMCATWFERRFTPMGYCFTFNAKGNLTQDGGGMASGLTLTLVTDQVNNIALSDYTSGFRVVLHDPHEYPNPARGIKVNVGQVTTVKMKKEVMTLLRAPYGECRSKALRFFSVYTRENCQVECLSAAVERECGCAALGLPGGNTTAETCDPKQEVTCAYELIARKDQLSCDCPVACRYNRYLEYVSSSSMAEYFINYVQYNYSNGDITRGELLRNVASFTLYFPDLSYTEISTQVSYTIVQLFCDMGGALGLLLGSTFFTLYEFLDFFIWTSLERCATKRVDT